MLGTLFKIFFELPHIMNLFIQTGKSCWRALQKSNNAKPCVVKSLIQHQAKLIVH